jgi:hypothetical protein
VSSKFAGELRVPPGHRSGDHRTAGMLIAHGPGISRLRLDRLVHVTEVAGTVAAGLGIGLPSAERGPMPELAGAASGSHR